MGADWGSCLGTLALHLRQHICGMSRVWVGLLCAHYYCGWSWAASEAGSRSSCTTGEAKVTALLTLCL